MIIKHIPMKVIKKSSFASLVNYLTNTQSKQERVGKVTVTNCHQTEALDAVLEIEAVQAQNTRAISDKTYHMIVSFRVGEYPGEDVIFAIEKLICEGLGYGEHQRISAIHHDTDNLHMHIAINKIHPLRHTLYEPYYDYKILGNLCEKLEIEYGLEKDNHKTKKHLAENLAHDMERHTGIESLLSFIKRECLASIKEADTWLSIQKILQDKGLEIKSQGNGLIIMDKKLGLRVKASSVDRSFSKNKLEARLGEFIPLNENHSSHKSQTTYQGKPIQTSALYTQYKNAQSEKRFSQRAELSALREQKIQEIEKAKNFSRLKRAAIKVMQGPGVNKKILYAMVSKSLFQKIEKLNKTYFQERQIIYQKNARYVWRDWLKKEALAGNADALKALRINPSKENSQKNTIKSQKNAELFSQLKPDNITKNGTIIYKMGDSAIRDDGKQLEISRHASQKELEGLLHMAIKRYGKTLTVNGTELFKRAIVETAVKANLEIKFEDKGLENQRQYIKRLLTIKEKNYDPHSRTENRAGIKFNRYPAGKFTKSGKFNRASSESNFATAGCQPPPFRKNSLRNLSELNVVFNHSRSQMLLPSHVPGVMEHQRAQPDQSLRWSIRESVGKTKKI